MIFPPKQRLLHELRLAPPATLSFVPVDFERQTWAAEIIRAGFDPSRSAVVSSLGVTQYLSVDAVQAMLGDVAALGPGAVFVCSFVLPVHLIEPDEHAMRAETEARAAAGGHPWLSAFLPDGIFKLAEEAGFADVAARDTERPYRSLLRWAHGWAEALESERLYDRVDQVGMTRPPGSTPPVAAGPRLPPGPAGARSRRCVCGPTTSSA